MDSGFEPEFTGQHFAWELDQLNDQLDESIGALRIAGSKKAETERDYRVALAKKIIALRALGTPVTIINDLARGDEEVATLRLKRDVAESEYWTSQEVINVGKLRVRTVNDQIGREWGRPSNM